jgi:ligand-binding sensor domain-containing protein
MKHGFLIGLLFLSVQTVFGQHLYPEKYEECKLSRFCLDCGEPKAEVPQDAVESILSGLNQKSLKKINGLIRVQILVDTLGNSCLVSSENSTGVSSKKLGLQNAINSMPKWTPSMKDNKAQSASVSLELVFQDEKFGIRRVSFDFKNNTNFKSVGTPDVKGSKEKDLSVQWTVLSQSNSDLPWDMTRTVVSTNNNLWIGTDNGLVRITDEKMEIFDVTNSAIRPVKYNQNIASSIRHAATDSRGNIWLAAGWDAYKFDGNKWTVYDSINSPIEWPRKIFSDNYGNVFVTSWDGLAKYDGENWSVIDTSNSELPSNKVSGVYLDNQDRLWIGTFDGNIRIDKDQTIEFNESDSPLKEGSISQVLEDSKGNFWFDLYSKDKTKAGMWLLKSSGEWTSIKPKNSELFIKNDINDFLLDEENGVLWIALNSVGLIRYDIENDKWETYTPENSEVPSIHVMKLTKDKSGIIWAATFAGVIKMNK